MKKLSFLMVLFVLYGLFILNSQQAIAADETNLIDDGGFESGDLSSWTVTGAKEKFQITQDNTKTGKYALHISGPQNYAYISKAFNAVAGTEYTLSFYAKGTGDFVYRLANPKVKPPVFARADSGNTASDWQRCRIAARHYGCWRRQSGLCGRY
jgi:hypothetical protein